MKYIISIATATLLLSSCIQNYSEKYKIEATKTCECMQYKQAARVNITEDIAFIYDDVDYKDCVLDAIINEVKTKSDEFTSAIKDICPEQLKTQKRYVLGV